MTNFYLTSCNLIPQGSKLNFKWLFSLCLVALFFLPSNSLLAQPISFDVTGCNANQPNSDGSYTQGVDVGGCPCYQRSGGGVIFRNGIFWNHLANGDCTSAVIGGTIFQAGPGSGGCDITQAIAGASFLGTCNPSVLSNFQYAPPVVNDVPTLSEWGLIILALLLMTMGTLYLVQPSEETYLLKDIEK